MNGKPALNTEKKAGKGRRVKWGLLIAGFCLFAFVAGYLFAGSGLKDSTAGIFRNLFNRDGSEIPVDENDDKEEPGDEQADPGRDDPAEPGDDPEPADPGSCDPVIYPGQVLIVPKPQGGGLSKAQVVQKGTLESSSKRIALTFDSGWLYDQAIPLLDTLDQYGVTATFFPRAYWIKDHPNLGKEIVSRGHTMGNHSLTHPHMREMTVEEMRHEMRESTRIIQEVTGVRPYLFRPPYGEYDNRLLEVLAEEGYPYNVMWTIDTLDWAAGTTRNVGGQQVLIDVDFIVNRVLDNATSNGIVLMHIGLPQTVEALPRIIEGLQGMGYDFATVDEMLPRPESVELTHTVKQGETLFSIAQKYGVNVQQIISANDL